MFLFGFWIFLNFYLGFLCASALYFQDMVYLNLLLVLTGTVWGILDWRKYRKVQKWIRGEREISLREMYGLLGEDVSEYLKEWEEEKRQEQLCDRERLEELADYVAGWTHEAKLPLASLKLMNNRNENRELCESMGSCIARLEILLQNVLAGSKLQRPENDVRYEKISLEEAVRASVRNQSYFLMHHKFEILVECGGIQVYSDKRWLVYLLDQLTGNAVKYGNKKPKLCFRAEKEKSGAVLLTVEDNGIGILKEDLPYIFDKGYVGSRHRKGDYHSTGMGLYFAKKIAELLNIDMEVCSEEGKGSRFELRFRDLSEHLLLSGEKQTPENRGEETLQKC